MGKPGQRRVADRFRLPRARVAVPIQLRIGDGSQARFSARLATRDLSVSGAFLESSYFLPVGTRLSVSFQLDDGSPEVKASAEIVRHQRAGRGGFAIRFFEFEGGARVAVAELVLGERLREFTRRYLASRRARSFTDQAERMVDLLASWELSKATER